MSTTWKSWSCLYLYSNRGTNSQKSTQPNCEKKKKPFWKVVGLTRREQPSVLSSFPALTLRVFEAGFSKARQRAHTSYIHVTCVEHETGRLQCQGLLLWLCWDCANAFPYGVCLHCKLCTVKRNPWLPWVSFIPRLSSSQRYHSTCCVALAFMMRCLHGIHYKREEKTLSVDKDVNLGRIYPFSLRGQAVSFRFKWKKLPYSTWSFLRIG